MRSREVSSGAKLVYARLCRYAGKDGVANPRLEELADEIAASKRSVQTYIQELEKAGLIESEQVGLGEPNRYYFLWSPMIEGTQDDPPAPSGDRSGVAEVATPDWQDPATPDWQTSATPSISPESESESSSRASRRDLPEQGIAAAKPRKKHKRPDIDTDEGLASNRFPDEAEEQLPAPRLRPKRWSIRTLVEEFSFRALGATTVPSPARDTNRSALGQTIKKWVEQGSTTYDDVAEAMDVFFTIPEARLRKDSTLWQSFVNSYSEIALRHSTTTRITTSAHDEELDNMTKEQYSAYLRSRGGRL